MNAPLSLVCGVCGTEKAVGGPSQSGSMWMCSHCTLQNDETALECLACGQVGSGGVTSNGAVTADAVSEWPSDWVPTVEQFECAAEDIAALNEDAPTIFATLRSVAKKLLKVLCFLWNVAGTLRH